MSSVPPNMPPGGARPPYPRYDPKTQYRVYREQQKAAWRAQREAWKAQRYAWKAGYVGAYGPRVPSIVGPVILVGVGIVALLVVTGHIAGEDFWGWYGRWWPLLLIGAGIALIGEWALDMRRETPVRRSGSFVGILILLAILGFGASGWHHMRPWFNHMGDEGGMNDDFFNAFGLPQHDMDEQVLSSQIPANSAVQIENPRGDVSITSGDGPNIEVHAHAVAFASTDSDANKIFAAEAGHVTVNGNSVTVKSDGNDNGRLNLTVTVPKSARVTINAGRGDVTAAGLGAGISVTAPHGDVHLSAISGSVEMHFSGGKHDFSAHQVDGDLITDGDCNDLTLSEIKGKIVQNGEILGDVHIENIGGPVHLHTSVTDLQLASLPGDLTLNSDDLRVAEAKGPVHVTTHSKDVDLNQIYGDSSVDDRDGTISVEPAGAYAIDAKNGKGDIEVTLPPNASATVDGHARNGDIVTEYALSVSGDENKTVNGKIGSGASKVVLNADNGDVRIKKGAAFPATPPTPVADTVPKAPPAANAPHLKAPKAAPPTQPVTQ
jgi:DUF4097 and DUF4098 domain-containing protein YvlB